MCDKADVDCPGVQLDVYLADYGENGSNADLEADAAGLFP